MKAKLKQEVPQTSDFDDTEDDSYAAYEAELAAKRKPYEELIDYISANPALSPNFTTDKGDKTSRVIDVDALLNWEENYTNIYMSKVGEEPTVYIWRIFRRYEYLKTLGDSTSAPLVDWDNDKQRQDYLIKQCLLFPNPSLHFRANTPAGVLPTLEKQILYKSGFVGDQEALSTISIIG